MTLNLPHSREQLLAPPPALRPVVQQLVLLTHEAGAPAATHTLWPTFQVTLFFNLGSGAVELWPAGPGGVVPVQRLVGAGVLGPLKTAWQYRLSGGARVLVVNFTLAGFYRLFRVPVDRLGAGLTDPDDLPGQASFAALGGRLRALPGLPRLGQALAAFCRPYLRPAEAPQAELLARLPVLAHQPHLDPARAIAAASQLSARAVQLRFRKYLGFSAKEVARFLRLRRVLASLAQRPAAAEKPDWFALLDQHGYYDQSHLIHDFTHFLHQSPSEVTRQLLTDESLCLPRAELLGL